MISKQSVKAARELRDTIQQLLETAYSRGTIPLHSVRTRTDDTFGLSIKIGDQYLELHVYANLEEE